MNVPDYEPSPANGKRKRGMKSLSVTPSVVDDDDDDRDSVRVLQLISQLKFDEEITETTQDEGCRASPCNPR
jgi:hypothetical protein